MEEKEKERWVHYCKYPDGLEEQPTVATCGKIITHKLVCRGDAVVSQNLSCITCENCIEILKKKHWFCEQHGFINDINVTNDERCDICGMSAVA